MLDGQFRPWVLEVNTIPGLTARSLSPRSAQAAGIEFPALVDWMVRDAIDRRPRGADKSKRLRFDPSSAVATAGSTARTTLLSPVAKQPPRGWLQQLRNPRNWLHPKTLPGRAVLALPPWAS